MLQENRWARHDLVASESLAAELLYSKTCFQQGVPIDPYTHPETLRIFDVLCQLAHRRKIHADPRQPVSHVTCCMRVLETLPPGCYAMPTVC
jgi:hypothetical protein